MVIPSSELGLPPPQASVSPSWTQKGGDQHSLATEEVGGNHFGGWIESLALCLVYTLCSEIFCVIKQRTLKKKSPTQSSPACPSQSCIVPLISVQVCGSLNKIRQCSRLSFPEVPSGCLCQKVSQIFAHHQIYNGDIKR
jgi:hypothetical protein